MNIRYNRNYNVIDTLQTFRMGTNSNNPGRHWNPVQRQCSELQRRLGHIQYCSSARHIGRWDWVGTSTQLVYLSLQMGRSFISSEETEYKY